jgi:hypothetical protein
MTQKININVNVLSRFNNTTPFDKSDYIIHKHLFHDSYNSSHLSIQFKFKQNKKKPAFSWKPRVIKNKLKAITNPILEKDTISSSHSIIEVNEILEILDDHVFTQTTEENPSSFDVTNDSYFTNNIELNFIHDREEQEDIGQFDLNDVEELSLTPQEKKEKQEQQEQQEQQENMSMQQEDINCSTATRYQTKIETSTKNGKLLISRDYGRTWGEPKVPLPSDVTVVAFCVGKRVQLCLGTYDSIYHSFDNGESWIKARNQPQIHDWVSLEISNDDEKIEAKTRGGSVYVSHDLGDNWTQV